MNRDSSLPNAPSSITPVRAHELVLEELLATNQRLRTLAEQDPLTGTLNRRGLSGCLGRLCEGGEAPRVPVLLIDCDDFKTLNDRHGHAVGDAVLIELVHRLRSSVRDRDPVARVGGDEFVVLLPHTDLRAAERIGRQVCDRVSAAPVAVGEMAVPLTVSVGVAEARVTDASVEPLLVATRAALRQSKSEGKNQASYVGAAGGAGLARGGSLLHALLRCSLSAEPILSVREGTPVGHEWRVRGSSAEIGSSSDLFRVARQRGEETVVDLAFLRLSARAALEARFAGRVHLNLFPGTVCAEPDAVAQLVRPLCEAGHEVVIELSLERLGRCPDALLEAMRALAQIGVRGALCDAGHGSTSLDAILALEPAMLKMRPEWTAALTDAKPDAARRARALRRMADGLGVELVATGVERARDLGALATLGIHLAQGRWLATARTL